MKKIGIFTIISVLAGMPSFADIAANESNPTCDSTTIGVSSGNTTLDAVWNANTLNLKFMANGQQFASNTCTYGGTITIPETEPIRTGYNFAGWRIKPSSCAAITSQALCEEYEELGCEYYNGTCRVVSLDINCFSETTQEWCEANGLYWRNDGYMDRPYCYYNPDSHPDPCEPEEYEIIEEPIIEIIGQ